jgi:hypothetical protein
MKFQFNTTLENVSIPGADAQIGKIDVSISMEMEDSAYTGIVELVYDQLNTMFGMPSSKPSDDEQSSGGRWQVYCREDTDAEGNPGPYMRATRRTFGTEDEALRYASGINPDREPFVTAAPFDESPFP